MREQRKRSNSVDPFVIEKKASESGPRYRVELPPGLRTLLVDLTREIIQKNPKDISAFATAFLDQKLAERARDVGPYGFAKYYEDDESLYQTFQTNAETKTHHESPALSPKGKDRVERRFKELHPETSDRVKKHTHSLSPPHLPSPPKPRRHVEVASRHAAGDGLLDSTYPELVPDDDCVCPVHGGTVDLPLKQLLTPSPRSQSRTPPTRQSQSKNLPQRVSTNLPRRYDGSMGGNPSKPENVVTATAPNSAAARDLIGDVKSTRRQGLVSDSVVSPVSRLGRSPGPNEIVVKPKKTCICPHGPQGRQFPGIPATDGKQAVKSRGYRSEFESESTRGFSPSDETTSWTDSSKSPSRLKAGLNSKKTPELPRCDAQPDYGPLIARTEPFVARTGRRQAQGSPEERLPKTEQKPHRAKHALDTEVKDSVPLNKNRLSRGGPEDRRPAHIIQVTKKRVAAPPVDIPARLTAAVGLDNLAAAQAAQLRPKQPRTLADPPAVKPETSNDAINPTFIKLNAAVLEEVGPKSAAPAAGRNTQLEVSRKVRKSVAVTGLAGAGVAGDQTLKVTSSKQLPNESAVLNADRKTRQPVSSKTNILKSDPAAAGATETFRKDTLKVTKSREMPQPPPEVPRVSTPASAVVGPPPPKADNLEGRSKVTQMPSTIRPKELDSKLTQMPSIVQPKADAAKPSSIVKPAQNLTKPVSATVEERSKLVQMPSTSKPHESAADKPIQVPSTAQPEERAKPKADNALIQVPSSAREKDEAIQTSDLAELPPTKRASRYDLAKAPSWTERSKANAKLVQSPSASHMDTKLIQVPSSADKKGDGAVASAACHAACDVVRLEGTATAVNSARIKEQREGERKPEVHFATRNTQTFEEELLKKSASRTEALVPGSSALPRRDMKHISEEEPALLQDNVRVRQTVYERPPGSQEYQARRPTLVYSGPKASAHLALEPWVLESLVDKVTKEPPPAENAADKKDAVEGGDTTDREESKSERRRREKKEKKKKRKEQREATDAETDDDSEKRRKKKKDKKEKEKKKKGKSKEKKVRTKDENIQASVTKEDVSHERSESKKDKKRKAKADKEKKSRERSESMKAKKAEKRSKSRERSESKKAAKEKAKADHESKSRERSESQQAEREKKKRAREEKKREKAEKKAQDKKAHDKTNKDKKENKKRRRRSRESLADADKSQHRSASSGHAIIDGSPSTFPANHESAHSPRRRTMDEATEFPSRSDFRRATIAQNTNTITPLLTGKPPVKDKTKRAPTKSPSRSRLRRQTIDETTNFPSKHDTRKQSMDRATIHPSKENFRKTTMDQLTNFPSKTQLRRPTQEEATNFPSIHDLPPRPPKLSPDVANTDEDGDQITVTEIWRDRTWIEPRPRTPPYSDHKTKKELEKEEKERRKKEKEHEKEQKKREKENRKKEKEEQKRKAKKEKSRSRRRKDKE